MLAYILLLLLLLLLQHCTAVKAENCAKLIARGMGLPLHEAVAYRQGKGAVSSFSRGAVAATLQQVRRRRAHGQAHTAGWLAACWA